MSVAGHSRLVVSAAAAAEAPADRAAPPGHGISITSASLDGQALPMQRLKRGLQLDATYMVPSPAYQTAMLQVVTDTPGAPAS